jgi:hypothetical protein
MVAALFNLAVFVVSPQVFAAEGETEMTEAEKQAQIAEAMANPLSYLWLMFTQNDTKSYDGDLLDTLGEDSKILNTYMINPVLSVQLTEEWKSIIRPAITVQSFPTIGGVDITTGSSGPSLAGVDIDRETGLGDSVLFNVFSNKYEAPLVLGAGYTAMFPTATHDQLGTGKYSAGPAALGAYITDKWIIGGVAQHWWSFAGEDDITISTSAGDVTRARPDVSLTDFQYIIRYRVSPKTNIGCAPNIQYNWKTNEASIPIGIGADTMIQLGPLPVKVGLEYHHYVKQDDAFGPQWQVRFFFVPVLPAPKWAREPLFGN